VREGQSNNEQTKNHRGTMRSERIGVIFPPINCFTPNDPRLCFTRVFNLKIIYWQLPLWNTFLSGTGKLALNSNAFFFEWREERKRRGRGEKENGGRRRRMEGEEGEGRRGGRREGEKEGEKEGGGGRRGGRGGRRKEREEEKEEERAKVVDPLRNLRCYG